MPLHGSIGQTPTEMKSTQREAAFHGSHAKLLGQRAKATHSNASFGNLFPIESCQGFCKKNLRIKFRYESHMEIVLLPLISAIKFVKQKNASASALCDTSGSSS